MTATNVILTVHREGFHLETNPARPEGCQFVILLEGTKLRCRAGRDLHKGPHHFSLIVDER